MFTVETFPNTIFLYCTIIFNCLNSVVLYISAYITLFLNFQSSFNGHKNIVGFIDSSIVRHNNGVHEVLMLMPYCPSNVLTLINNR